MSVVGADSVRSRPGQRWQGSVRHGHRPLQPWSQPAARARARQPPRGPASPTLTGSGFGFAPPAGPLPVACGPLRTHRGVRALRCAERLELWCAETLIPGDALPILWRLSGSAHALRAPRRTLLTRRRGGFLHLRRGRVGNAATGEGWDARHRRPGRHRAEGA